MGYWNIGTIGVPSGKVKSMLRPADAIRYHITAILAAHWVQFIAQYKRWLETYPKFLMYPGGLKKRWKYQFTTRMKRAHREGPWRFLSEP